MLLTIGMATYDDFDGVYFTLEALKAYHDLEDVELVVVDTKTEPCKDTQNTCNHIGAKYYHRPDKVGTSASRNHVFEVANGRFVMCIDCHVLLVKDSVKKLKEYLKANMNSNDLLQGPLLYDDQKHTSTHFDPQWRGQMYGTWGTDQRYLKEDSFEIPMQGLGLFCMRKAVWPKFNANFRGFGGEEGYIHEKVRQNGGKALCLSWLKWIHRFARPKGVPYPLNLKDRVINYLIGWIELGLDYSEILEFFKNNLNAEKIAECLKELSSIYGYTLTASPKIKEQIKKIFYVIGNEHSEIYKSFETSHQKFAIGDYNLISILQDFVNREERYCIILSDIIDQKTINKLDEWIMIKMELLKIASLKPVVEKSLQRKCDWFSYRIADNEDIDLSKSLVISKDFAKLILKEQNISKLSSVAIKNNIKPFVLSKIESIYKANPHICPFDNVSGDLDYCDIREITLIAKGRWCLDVSALSHQTTLALCQKGAGIVRVFDFQNEDKDVLSKDLSIHGFVNYVVADMTEDLSPPADGKRLMLINYKDLPEYMKDFAYEKQNSFIRSGDVMVLTFAEPEIKEVFSPENGFTVNFESAKSLIVTKT